MNIDESITYLAQKFSRGCHTITQESDIIKTLPYFRLSRERVTPYNYLGHETYRRMPDICSYLSNNIIPKMQETPKGFYNIELYDTHSHTNNTSHIPGTCFNNVFCFSTRKSDPFNKHVPLLPDYYFMNNWDNRYNYINDETLWKNKHSKIVFVGSTTGNSNPHQNERIQTCLWSLEQGLRHICHFYIVGFMRMNSKHVFQQLPQLKFCTLPKPVTPKQQMRYKYMLNIDGDTCRWNPDVYFMNTLNFQTPSKDMLWYYPLLKNKEHFVEVSLEQHAPNYIIKMFSYYENNPAEAEHIISNANNIRKYLFTPRAGILYTTHLLDNIIYNTAP